MSFIVFFFFFFFFFFLFCFFSSCGHFVQRSGGAILAILVEDHQETFL